ncbi:hypothetical protein J8M20_08825 [Pseudoalteromonas luteoviolacea]|uniref:hypothetical protein n=1 Tax=Pseudoalteromonas luteoviolacea TaxID=43657 RepID=UPI001B36B278|nr:hypothetical protein [Pseudoalteromonas luteoviolacea]MBQ4811439.1 hypothetical protein [Pseudoalteromonas luteoviolacea]
MSNVQEVVHRCIHPLTKITSNQARWVNKHGSLKLKDLVPEGDFQWQLALDPCNDKAATLHSIKLAPSSSFTNRANIDQAATLTLKLHMQDPHWEFTEIIFNPDASTRVYTELPQHNAPIGNLIMAQVDLADRKLATITIRIPSQHPQMDLSPSSPVFEFFVRGKHLQTGQYFCTEEINILT